MQSEITQYSDLLGNSSFSYSTVFSMIQGLDAVATNVVARCRKWKCAISFSSGVDSSILATLFSQTCNTEESVLITAGAEESLDVLEEGIEAPSYSGISRRVCKVPEERIEEAARHVLGMVSVDNIAHLEDCTAFYIIAEQLTKTSGPEFERLISANGTDELFCGYDRFRRIAKEDGYESVTKEISRSLVSARKLKKEVRIVLSHFGLDSFEPFLEEDFVWFASENIPAPLKINADDDKLRKRIWRCYARYLGIPDSIVTKPKKAMQYSMGVDRVLRRMIKRGNLKSLNKEK